MIRGGLPGRALPPACRAWTRYWRAACRSRWVPVGSAKAAECPGRPGAALGALPVVRRAGGACAAEGPAVRGPRNRPTAGAVTIDDLARTAPERGDAQWYASISGHGRAIEGRAGGRRPKVAKLAGNEPLHVYVRDRLAGAVTYAASGAIPGPGVAWNGRRHGQRADRRWGTCWSPEQISRRLRIDFPLDESMRISHEAIYQALYSRCVAPCGANSPPVCAPVEHFGYPVQGDRSGASTSSRRR